MFASHATVGDPIITRRLTALAEHIRSAPPGPVREGLVDSFFSLVGYLESLQLIQPDSWHLAPRDTSDCTEPG